MRKIIFALLLSGVIAGAAFPADKKADTTATSITKTSVSNINTTGGTSKRRSRLAVLSCQTVLKAS